MFGSFGPIVFGMNQSSGQEYYKDLIHRTPNNVQLPAGLGSLLGFLSPFINTPLIRALLRRSFLMVCYAMVYFRNRRDFLQSYRLLTGCLLTKHLRKNPKHWWYLMRAAVALVQTRENNAFEDDLSIEDTLILLGNSGPQPLEGYDVAYVFLGYSLWFFERGEVQVALRMVKIAEQADPSWGYPTYLHGWYQLFHNEKEAIDYFVRAVQMDWSFLHKMKEDTICKEHPKVLQEVRLRTLVSR